MKARTLELVVGVGSLVLGAVVGAAIDRGLNNGLSLQMLVLLVLAVGVFVMTAIAFVAERDNAASNTDLLGSILRLEKRLGLQVMYQELRDIGNPRVHTDDILARLMRNAHGEILEASRSEIHEPEINPDLPPSQVRVDYYDSILERAVQQTAHGQDFVYKRIIQFAEPNATLRSLGDTVYVDHCRKMVELQHSSNLQAYVKRTLLSFPTAFLMIDRQYLVITLDAVRYHLGRSERHQKAEIIINDPQQELIRVFMREWDRMENSPNTHTVTLEEF